LTGSVRQGFFNGLLRTWAVPGTHNFAERIIWFAVLWRKRRYGTKSNKGNCWVERILSLLQPYRLPGKSTFDVLVNAIDSYFKLIFDT